jgi:hypothetical protein
MISNDENYFSLGTLKRDGSFVDTPVWFTQETDAEVYLVLANANSGKVKRIRNFKDAQVAVCDWKGGLKGEWQKAEVKLVDELESHPRLFRAKYGLQFRIFEFFSWLSGKRKERQMILVTILD